MRDTDVIQMLQAVEYGSEVMLPIVIDRGEYTPGDFICCVTNILKHKNIKNVILSKWSERFFITNSFKNMDALFNLLLTARVTNVQIDIDCKVNQIYIDQLYDYVATLNSRQINVWISHPRSSKAMTARSSTHGLLAPVPQPPNPIFLAYNPEIQEAAATIARPPSELRR